MGLGILLREALARQGIGLPQGQILGDPTEGRPGQLGTLGDPAGDRMPSLGILGDPVEDRPESLGALTEPDRDRVPSLGILGDPILEQEPMTFKLYGGRGAKHPPEGKGIGGEEIS